MNKIVNNFGTRTNINPDKIIDINSSKGLLVLIMKDSHLLEKYALKESDFDFLLGEYRINDNGEYVNKNNHVITKLENESRYDFFKRMNVYDGYYERDYKKIFNIINNNFKNGKHVTDYSELEYPWIIEHEWEEKAVDEDLEYYYNTVRKTTILREAASRGTFLLDYIYHLNNDFEKKKAFDEISIEELLEKATVPIEDLYEVQKYSTKKDSYSFESIDVDKEVNEYLTKSPWGITSVSPLLNTITHGWCKDTFYEVVAPSGAGKSTFAFSNMANAFSPLLKTDNGWVENNISNEKCLYIGTEMDPKIQWIPQVVCSAARLNWNKVKVKECSFDDLKDVKKVLESFKDKDNIFLSKKPDYDEFDLIRTIKTYKRKHNVSTVFIDYLEPTAKMAEENDDDLKIFNKLAKVCKDNIAALDVAVIGFAQANISLENKKLSEIDAGCIKGSHTLHQKADTLMFLVEGGEKDIEYLSKANGSLKLDTQYFDQFKSLGIYKNDSKLLDPKRIRKILIRKNRADGSMNNLCVWSFIENGTLRWHDLFATDLNYQIIDIKPTYLPKEERGCVYE